MMHHGVRLHLDLEEIKKWQARLDEAKKEASEAKVKAVHIQSTHSS